MSTSTAAATGQVPSARSGAEAGTAPGARPGIPGSRVPGEPRTPHHQGRHAGTATGRRAPLWAGAVAALRLPTAEDPAPPVRRMALLSTWAAVLGLIGMAVAARAFVAILFNAVPALFEPTMIVVGLAGVGLTVGAFVTVHDRRLPWLLLGAATVALAVVLGLAILVV
jgi:hypothetical protein